MLIVVQGGYPWTHLYKTPLAAGEEPELILNYKYSPRSRRRGESVDSLGTPKSQKKVRIQDEVEFREAENPQTNDENENSVTEILDVKEEITEATGGEEKIVEIFEEKVKETKNNILENSKASISKSDSGSLKRKIKNPLERIKRMADNHFKKVKSSIPKMPFKKGEIVLNEELTIRKLKESPKAERREITSYVFKHQDSDDTIEIVQLEESPMENRRRKENKLVTPDEIIELPTNEDDAQKQQQEVESEASTIDTNDITLSESSSQKDETNPSKSSVRGREYEDIEDYISKITSDIEHVERNPNKELKRQNDIMSNEAIFDEFSMVMNRNIRKSLSAQDERIRQELAKRIPKIEDLEKQISDEDKEEKAEEVTQKQIHLLAPISSIDSTSSDEHSKIQLSILAEESETSDSKRKSFETEASVDNEVESLKNDGSDVSTTLIEDELLLSLAIKQSTEDEKMNDKITIEPPLEIKVDNHLEPEPKQDEILLKEDVDVVVENLSAEPAKINSKWSKIGFVFSIVFLCFSEIEFQPFSLCVSFFFQQIILFQATFPSKIFKTS